MINLGGDIINTIVFLGTQKSGSSREAIRAAEDLGFYTCLLTDNPKIINQRSEFPDVHLMQYCELSNIEKVREKIRLLRKHSLNICSIVAFTDPYCALASQIADEFGLPSNSTEAMYIMQNKLKSREMLKNTPYNPNYYVLDKSNMNQEPLFLPAVVKYIDSNGSKDVYCCHTKEDYENNVYQLFKKYPDGNVLVEEYLDGPQYIVETIVINKKVKIIAIIAQEIENFNDHFIITGYKLYFDYPKEFYDSLKEAIEDILSTIKFESGPCHFEIRHVNGKWKLVEINPRISGAGMNQLLLTGLGVNVVKETLKLSLGLEADFDPRFTRHTYAKYKVLNHEGRLMRITGRVQAINSPGVEYIFVKPKKGTFLSTPHSMGNRYAYVIATGNSSEEARENAIKAVSKISFHLTYE